MKKYLSLAAVALLLLHGAPVFASGSSGLIPHDHSDPGKGGKKIILNVGPGSTPATYSPFQINYATNGWRMGASLEGVYLGSGCEQNNGFGWYQNADNQTCSAFSFLAGEVNFYTGTGIPVGGPTATPAPLIWKIDNTGKMFFYNQVRGMLACNTGYLRIGTNYCSANSFTSGAGSTTCTAVTTPTGARAVKLILKTSIQATGAATAFRGVKITVFKASDCSGDGSQYSGVTREELAGHTAGIDLASSESTVTLRMNTTGPSQVPATTFGVIETDTGAAGARLSSYSIMGYYD